MDICDYFSFEYDDSSAVFVVSFIYEETV